MPNTLIIKLPTKCDLIVPSFTSRRIETLETFEASKSGWQSSSDLKPRRGPRPGSVARYTQSDRAIFDDISRMIERGISLMEAVRTLDNEQKVTGRGTPESRIRRVMRLYKKERSNARP
jgi:hypothetical protein